MMPFILGIDAYYCLATKVSRDKRKKFNKAKFVYLDTCFIFVLSSLLFFNC